MKKRSLIIGLLVMLAVITSGFTYAYWSNIVRAGEVNDTEITIGEGINASFEVELNGSVGGPLVPYGQEGNSLGSVVEYVLLTFDVDWADNQFTNGTIVVTPSAIKIDSENTYASLVNITYQVGGTGSVTDDTVNEVYVLDSGNPAVAPGEHTVYVLVQLSEPTDQTEYEAIIDGIITFELDFVVNNLS